MGKKEKPVKKVVLDTNVLISSILFKGELARIVDLWKRGKIVPVISRETFNEFRSVLEYPKFRLTKGEIKAIIEEEVLPFFEIVEITSEVSGVCKDPDDDKFIACALSASADFIVSGDKDLCDVVTHKSIKIIRASHLMKMID
ncbi:MAG TPA: putative toxin-antitoxin system toxin component, PIN family [Thermodesulfovibrionales bacterium]|nr:putative toxin-antitoxin system toxin component, PIN family [Thermodesulfovibrionales bacterium]